MDQDAHLAPRRRPGGRTAQVTDAVHRAVLDTVIERGVDNVGIPDISRRAGVRDSTIYRRWGTRENLVLDVMLTASDRTLPLPDTGSLRGDLTAFATGLSDYLDTALGRGLVQALAFITDSPEIEQARNTFWHQRFTANEAMIDRAAARGEIPASANAHTAIELLIAPIHFRHLLTRRPCDAAYVDNLVTHVIGAMNTSHQAD